jgi:nitrate/nitrite transporter NarK
VREYYPPAQAGTAVGVANSCGFLSTAVYQEISTAIIKSYGFEGDTTHYVRDAYRYGLWLFFLVSFLVSAVLITIVRDSDLFIKKKEEPETEDGAAKYEKEIEEGSDQAEAAGKPKESDVPFE